MVSIVFFLHLGSFPCTTINVITNLLCFLLYDSMTELYNCNATPSTHLCLKYSTGETAPPTHRNSTRIPMGRHMGTPNYTQVCTHRHTVLHIYTHTHIHSLVHSMHILVWTVPMYMCTQIHLYTHMSTDIHTYQTVYTGIVTCIHEYHTHAYVIIYL